jgi:4-amino-4-deoxy-L-arabinose transferase-like glycosyltransferase
MTQTTGRVGESDAIKPSGQTRQKPVFQEMKQRLAPYFSSNWVLCILVAAVALAFDLYRLGTPSIWFDEAFSVELARQPLPLLWHIIWGPEPNMELYYLFLHFWLGFTGFLGLHPTEFVVRSPSAIFAALSSVMVFLLGRRYLGITAGIVGAGLYLLNDLQLTYAQQTRAYSLQLLLICVTWYALLAALTQTSHQKRWWACFIAATVLAVYAHLFSLIILLAQVVAIAGLLFLPGPWRARTRQPWRAFVVSLLSVGLLVIPMLLVSSHGSKTEWLLAPHLQDIYTLFLTISANSNIYLLLIFGCCALGIFASILVYLPSRRDGGQAQGPHPDATPPLVPTHGQVPRVEIAFALLCWLVVPVVASFIISQGSTRLFSSRYLVTILPPLFLLVGMGVSVLRWRTVQVVLTIGLFLIALHHVPQYYQTAQVEDWNSTVHWLEQRYQAGDGLVCYDSDVEQGCQVSVEYYLHAYPSAAHFTGDSPGEFSWASFGPANPRSGPEAALDPGALAAYAAQHPRIFFITGRIPNDAAGARASAAQHWLDSHYHLIDRIVTRSVTISLYETNTT